jgi:hypothetical protein
VLSQLSYTPTVGTTIDAKVFAAVCKLQKLTFCSLPCQSCVRTQVVGRLVRQNPRRFVDATVDSIERLALCL